MIAGKKVILFDFEPKDLPDFVRLHREDRRGYMQDMCLKNMTDEEATKYVVALLATSRIKIWTVYTKEGKGARFAGFVYITDMTSFSCTINGIMDQQFAKGVVKLIRDKKYTYSEDALRTALRYLFNGAGFRRIDAFALSSNRRSIALEKKVGFKEEGLARKAVKIDDDTFSDRVNFGLLKEEFDNGQE
jgi:ribosomal-protein-alanine N-acetyltransferase